MTIGESRIGRLFAHSCVIAETLVAQGTAGNLHVENRGTCLMISVKVQRDSMGGPGSGRWYRWQGSKTTAEGCRQIDVRDWHRRGLLQRWGFTWSWHTRDGERLAWIQVRVQPGRQVILIFRVREGDGEWQDVQEPIVLTWTPCRYGGQRPWFLCPGVVNGRACGRRVAILYGAGRYFLCWRCYDLSYESQREDLPTRLISKVQKIRRRLGGSASLIETQPLKASHLITFLFFLATLSHGILAFPIRDFSKSACCLPDNTL
jgi:hypothetical protein